LIFKSYCIDVGRDKLSLRGFCFEFSDCYSVLKAAVVQVREGGVSPIVDFEFPCYDLIFKAIVSTSGGTHSRYLVFVLSFGIAM
jgi:hypothetical protein